MARTPPETATIEAVTQDGMGIAALPGKKVFVAGALAGETVRFQRRKRRRNFDVAELLEVLEPSACRIEARCAVFGRCGGCALQHVTAEEQRRIKLESLTDSLERIGRVVPERWLEPLYHEDPWHYRRRARLAVKDVPGKGRVLVGFRERHAPFVTDMHRCEVLGMPVAELIDPLSAVLSELSIRNRVPQIEVAIGDNATELIFRVLDPPAAEDRAKLAAFAARYGVRISLQSGNADTVLPLSPDAAREPLSYALPDFDLTMQFAASDFVQVNAAVNRRMVRLAVDLLEVTPEHRVFDLYSGLGNFSLPLARRAASVLGVEGDARLVARAGANAELNGIANARFVQADLDRSVGDAPWLDGGCDRLLLDPARSGAGQIVAAIDAFAAERIVYVSCHPGTLARDAGVLVHEAGYRLLAAGIMDMFPHTTHVESIALFSK